MASDRHLSDSCDRHLSEYSVGVQPQLPLEAEVIEKIDSDYDSVPGRRIAVNNNFIAFAINSGQIGVISKKSSVRSLIDGHDQRVTDMTFFSEEYNLLTSICLGRKVYVWKISQGPVKELRKEITAHKVLGIFLEEELESIHPRVCWHCRREEILFVAIGRAILKINTEKVLTLDPWTSLCEEATRLSTGIHFVGQHVGEVTNLSMCRRKNSILVSAATDGTLKVWKESSVLPIAEFKPHNNLPVVSATFISSPNHREDHTLLVTAASIGTHNGELKLWTSASDEGRLHPEDGKLWHCRQTLLLKCSDTTTGEAVLFDQVVGFPRRSLLVLASSQRKTLYAVHIEWGQSPVETRLEYLAEFSIAMPILSFSGLSNLSSAASVQLYCIMAETIEQYMLDVSRCSPPSTESELSYFSASPQPCGWDVDHTHKLLNQLITMQKSLDEKISTEQKRLDVKISTMEEKLMIETILKQFDTSLHKRLADQHFESTHQPLALLVGDIIKQALSRTTPPPSPSCLTNSQERKGILTDLALNLNGLLREIKLMKDGAAAARNQVGVDDTTIQVSKVLDEVWEMMKIVEWWCKLK